MLARMGSSTRSRHSAYAALALAAVCGHTAAVPDPEAFSGLDALCAAPLQVTVRQPTVGELQQMELVSGQGIMVTYLAVQTVWPLAWSGRACCRR
jgi:hypothetical protein